MSALANGGFSPSLHAVRSFVVAARYLSFTAAAKELHVTQGAVSRMVRALEAELGVCLLHRVGRSLKLTAPGASYYAQVAEALDRIDGATRSVCGIHDGNALSINAPASFAMRWLVPRLHAFRQAYPDLLVDVTTKDGAIDFPASRTDVAIIYGLGKWDGVEAALLMREEMGVFCAPAFRAHATLRTPRDLPKQCLLQNSTRPQAWEQYASAFGFTLGKAVRTAVFEHFFMVVEAAAAGMGVALLPLYLVREEMLSGRLVQLFPHTLRPPEAYYVAHATHAGSARKIRLFKQWLAEEHRCPDG